MLSTWIFWKEIWGNPFDKDAGSMLLFGEDLDAADSKLQFLKSCFDFVDSYMHSFFVKEGQRSFWLVVTHPPVNVIAARLKLLLDLLLQEVDPELQAEVLFLQVIQVLRHSAVTTETKVRHDGKVSRGGLKPPI